MDDDSFDLRQIYAETRLYCDGENRKIQPEA